MTKEEETKAISLKAKLNQQATQLENREQNQSIHLVNPPFDPLADKQFLLGSMLLLFSLLIFLIFSYLIHKGRDIEQLLRAFGTILVITAAIFLIITGYSQEQIAPVIGLLGTIAGYLLGQTKAKKDNEK